MSRLAMFQRQDQEPATPRFPTADFAHEVAAKVAEKRSRKKKRRLKIDDELEV